MKIAFHPAFGDAARLADRYWRAVHYLGPLAERIDSIEMRTDLPIPAAPPDYLDQTLPGRAAMFRNRLSVRPARAQLDACDVVIVWDQACAQDPALEAAADVAVLDPAMLHEGDLWIEFGARIRSYGAAARANAHARLLDRCRQARADIAHVFGSGPSIATLDIAALPPGAAVICNSLVKNLPLLDRVRPAFITAVDPIYHAGASRHAEVFRAGLSEALRRSDALFVPQERDAHLYEGALPEDVRARITPVPVRYDLKPNLDLGQDYFVTATRNVLTLTLLPLAAQVGAEVRIYGCDGRPARETGRFWSYDPGSMFETELKQQAEAHPGFFTLDYQQYYALHCETVRQWVRAMEARGLSVRTATPSHIPALARRAMAGVTSPPPASLSFELEGAVAYAGRGAQSLYGAALADENAPPWLKSGLRGLVRTAKRLRG